MDKHFFGSNFLPSAILRIQALRAHRRSLATALISTLLCTACNDFENATNTQSSTSATATTVTATVQGLIAAGHPTLTPDNAKHVSTAPEGTGFTLRIETNASGLTDSRLATELNGNAAVQGENSIDYQTWLQREGPQAFILNANTARATALLPQVKINTALSFGWLAADAQFYVDEASTQVQLLGNAAPFSVTTRAQSELFSEVLLEIALDAPATEATRLYYQTQNGTAIANEDYLAMSGEVVFEVGQLSKIISIPLLNDQNSAAPRNEDDEYFRVLLSGTLAEFTGTVHGYGVIYNSTAQAENSPLMSASTTLQNTLPGTAGEQRAYLTRTVAGLSLSVANRCTLTLQANCTETPIQESGEGWGNIAWPTAPTTVQSYRLTNVTNAPIDYVVTFFDGDTTQQITGTVPANKSINIYTANINAGTANSEDNNESNNSSSSSAAAIPTELSTELQPKGLDATELTLDFTFDDNIAIGNLTADLNGTGINGNAIETVARLNIPYSQLINGLNILQVSANDEAGNTLSRNIQLYFASDEINTFMGDGDINIFIGQAGTDTFTGGAGTNIYLAGSLRTSYIGGSGENIFILQNGVSVDPFESQGDFIDQILLPGVSINSVLIRQYDEYSFYLDSEEQGFSAPNFFTDAGGIQSSIQRFIFADGELSAADIRQIIHAPSADNDNYWGFNTDDTIIDLEGRDNAFGGDGNDTLTVGGLAEGGAGNDTINADAAYGNEGDDILTATGYANGGAGNDLITAANTGEGGDGDDEVHATSPFGDAGNDILYTTGTNAFGGEGDDIIYGNDLSNDLFGELGNDTLYGYAGDDGLFGGDGNNTLDGGDGDDELFAARGDYDDILIGGNGNDKIWAYDGNNTIDAGPGDETIFIGNGNNFVDCGEGTHEIFANGAGNDTITCGSGDDEIYLDQGNDELSAGAGNDTVYASGPSSNEVTEENFHAGNKDLLLEDGDDELFLSGGLNCHIEGGDGNDTLRASCQQLTIEGGNGSDYLLLSALFQLSVTGGAGDDEINVGINTSAPLFTLDNEIPFIHYYWAPGDGNDTYLLSGTPPSFGDEETTSDIVMQRFNNSHFYLGGDSTLEKITFSQSDYSSLLMHYNNATTGATETLTFNYWFDSQTGQVFGDRFSDFQLSDNSTINTGTLNQYFNRFYHRDFDSTINSTGLNASGTPMATDQLVVSELSLLVDNQNYTIKREHQFITPDWTLEFWLLPPATMPTVTPILQWGEMPEGEDGFGLALHNNGESHEWRLQIGNENSVSVYDASALDSPVHIAISLENQQLQLFVNGQPSNTTLATVFSTETTAPLNFGYFDTSNAETAAWYLDELLITQETAKYSAPFIPDKSPTVLRFTP